MSLQDIMLGRRKYVKRTAVPANSTVTIQGNARRVALHVGSIWGSGSEAVIVYSGVGTAQADALVEFQITHPYFFIRIEDYGDLLMGAFTVQLIGGQTASIWEVILDGTDSELRRYY